jgi:hypothetical protein
MKELDTYMDSSQNLSNLKKKIIQIGVRKAKLSLIENQQFCIFFVTDRMECLDNIF